MFIWKARKVVKKSGQPFGRTYLIIMPTTIFALANDKQIQEYYSEMRRKLTTSNEFESDTNGYWELSFDPVLLDQNFVGVV